MFAELGYPIGHITNGVHPTAWLAPELAEVFNKHLLVGKTNGQTQSFGKQHEAFRALSCGRCAEP